MDNFSEAERLKFLHQRDGLVSAEEHARLNIKIYREAAKKLKQRYGRRANYRREFLQCALSFRFLLRINFLKQITS